MKAENPNSYFNPRYDEAGGALLSQFFRLPTDINGNRVSSLSKKYISQYIATKYD